MNKVNPRYEPVFTSRWQPGDYPHFLETCGREWENRENEREETKESDTKLPSGMYIRKRESFRQPTYEPAASPVRRAPNGDLLYSIINIFQDQIFRNLWYEI